MRSMGKTILVTGATDGIGKQTALELAIQGNMVIVHGRNDIRCRNVAEWMKNESGNSNIEYLVADFASFSDVRNMADEIKARFNSIDVLINNAGVYMNEFVPTTDGFESTFAINHLAPFLLTNLILDLIVGGGNSRIINVSSIAHVRAKLEWDNLNAEEFFDSYYAYSLSKLANILFTNKLARLLDTSSTTVNSLHPGVISTKLLYTGFNIEGASLEEGASTSVYLAASDDVSEVSGRYFVRSSETPAAPICLDKSVQDRLWDLSAGMVGLNTK